MYTVTGGHGSVHCDSGLGEGGVHCDRGIEEVYTMTAR